MRNQLEEIFPATLRPIWHYPLLKAVAASIDTDPAKAQKSALEIPELFSSSCR
jgi:hypothetical protein